jgi:hypothetical protein
MSTDLQHLIDRARLYEMTSDERESQARSFAYGNTRMENENITKADIDEAAQTVKQENQATVVVCS